MTNKPIKKIKWNSKQRLMCFYLPGNISEGVSLDVKTKKTMFL